jgi:bifunctional DNA-binding transcriptional regulator/antitoxin component of YhaV-PrlF toxin-antitoxin module
MNTLLQVNPRGTVTLPKSVRKLLGISNSGGIIIMNLRDNDVVLQPAIAFPVEMYTDARMAEFDAADAELGKRLAKRNKK